MKSVLFSLLFLVGCIIGCSGYEGPPLVTVTGIVTLDGQPMEGASVLFEPLDGSRGSVGKTDAEGRFSMSYVQRSGMPAGDYLVKISTIVEQTNESGEVTGISTETLPETYNTNTTLKETVTDSGGEFVFDLKSTGG